MPPPVDILVVQTAFPGDVVLTLPMVQRLARARPGTSIDVVTIPATAVLLEGHPDVRSVIEYDKRGRDSGPGGLLRLARRLKSGGYESAIVPHRSLRSALLVRLAGIPVRIGFDNSAGRFLWTAKVGYRPADHEILRNLSLLGPLGVETSGIEAPRLYPSAEEKARVDEFLRGREGGGSGPVAAVAPGSVWATKRWPEDRFADLVRELDGAGWTVVLVGGPADAPLCARIAATARGRGILDASGKFSLAGSAELIGRARVLVCNDSAPLHLAGAMGVRVVSIFGATVPSFGFGPIGAEDVVIETDGLACRPCGIHGGDRCPIGTFDCMVQIGPRRVLDAVLGRGAGRP